MRDKFVYGERDSGLRHNARHYQFTPLWIRYSEDCSFANRWMRINDSFDLAGVNILTPGDNHVFHAVQNVEKPFGILIANVAAADRSISKYNRSLFRIIPVSPHDIRTPGYQFTCSSGVNR